MHTIHARLSICDRRPNMLPLLSRSPLPLFLDHTYAKAMTIVGGLWVATIDALQIEDLNSGEYSGVFTATAAGTYSVSVTLQGSHIAGSPFPAEVHCCCPTPSGRSQSSHACCRCVVMTIALRLGVQISTPDGPKRCPPTGSYSQFDVTDILLQSA
jgi:hypothetical protein